MSLFERALFMSYLAGAGQITAEAGGAISFLTTLDEQGHYQLSPYGRVCERLRKFSLAHPEVGIPLTPFAVVLDDHHGAYPGFGERRAFWKFDYNAGDTMTWELVNLIWPGGWEVMGKNETGTMVNGPYGDTFDVLLQNASPKVLNSYPCLILSGDMQLSGDEVARYANYVQRGGTLILNSAYLPGFPQFEQMPTGALRHEERRGKGLVISYGPDFQVTQLTPIIQEQLAKWLPMKVSPGIQYLVNLKPASILVTLINNDGVTKEPKNKPIVDESKTRTVAISYQGAAPLRSVRDIKNKQRYRFQNGADVAITMSPGEVTVLEFKHD